MSDRAKVIETFEYRPAIGMKQEEFEAIPKHSCFSAISENWTGYLVSYRHPSNGVGYCQICGFSLNDK